MPMSVDSATIRPRSPSITADQKVIVVGAVLLLITALVRLVPPWRLEAEVDDVQAYRAMANIVLRDDNIYMQRVFFP